MKVLVAGVIGLAAVGISGAASAADFSSRAPANVPYAPVVVATVYDWTGLYVGANGGGATGRVNWNADGFGDEGSHDPSGGTFGGQVGYRWQTPSSWVFGVEAQGNWSDFKGSNVSQQFPGQTNQTTIESFALFTGQVGYAWDRTLIYAKGGAAVTDNKYTANSTLPPLIGVRCGAGIPLGCHARRRRRIRLRSKLVTRLRRPSSLDGQQGVSSPTGFLIADHIKEDVDLFSARVNYKFGGPGVGRY